MGNVTINRNDFLFLLGYIIWVLCGGFINVIGGGIYYFFKLATLGLWALAIFQKKWSVQEIWRYALFSFLCVLVFYNSRETDFIYLAILILAAKGYDIYKIAQIDYPIRIVSMLCTIILYLLQVVPGNDLVAGTSFLGTRYSLGYYHPNNLFAQVFLICIGIIIANHNRLNLGHYIVLFLFEGIFGVLTYSRTGMAILALLIILVAFYGKKRRVCHFMRGIFSYAFLLFSAFTMIGVTLFRQGNSLIMKIDDWISGRFTFASRFLEQYGSSLLGRNISYISTLNVRNTNVRAVVLDNLYAYLWITGGIIFFCVLIYMTIKMQKYLLSKEENILVCILFCYALYSVTEKVYFSVNNNYTLLLLGVALQPINRYLGDKNEKKFCI